MRNLVRATKKFLPGFCLSLLLGAFALAGCGLLRQPIQTPTPAPLRVTADEIARAMQEDHFFSDYGHNVLLVDGKVAAVTHQGSATILTLATAIDTKVQCDLGSSPAAVQPGDAVTVQSAEGQRQPSAVLLVNCTLLPKP